MKEHTCHLDHHQRSQYVTIGPEEKFHWVLQLINSQSVKLFNSLLEKYLVSNSPNPPNPNQKEKLFDSHEEKFLNTQHSSNQPNQSQNQSVIDQGNLISRLA